MPDYDVGAVSLSVPPNPGSVTTYRPAIRVRNNGIHDALAVGYLRIYQAGALIFSTDVYSGTITPGDEKDAQAVDYWTPPAQGTYIVQGYVSCENDQYEPNNALQPVALVIGATPPPPPPPVEAHAAQHEEDGSDEINVDGLQGKLSDAQTPTTHGNEHEAGGDDELNVDGLHGTLADGQPVAAHGNEMHLAVFEDTAHKGDTNGYASLDASAKVPGNQLPAIPNGVASQDALEGAISPGAVPTVLASWNIGQNAPLGTTAEVLLDGFIDVNGAIGSLLVYIGIGIHHDGTDPSALVHSLSFPAASPATTRLSVRIKCTVQDYGVGGDRLVCSMVSINDSPTGVVVAVSPTGATSTDFDRTSDNWISLEVNPADGGGSGTTFTPIVFTISDESPH